MINTDNLQVGDIIYHKKLDYFAEIISLDRSYGLFIQRIGHKGELLVGGGRIDEAAMYNYFKPSKLEALLYGANDLVLRRFV